MNKLGKLTALYSMLAVEAIEQENRMRGISPGDNALDLTNKDLDTIEIERIRAEEREAKKDQQRLRKGLTKYTYITTKDGKAKEVYLWALNKKSADRKARGKGYK